MTATPKTDILFDDFALLTKIFGQKELITSPPNTNCDCIGYSSTEDYEEFDTNQIAPSSGQAH